MGIDSVPREMEPVHREIFHFAIATGNIGEKVEELGNSYTNIDSSRHSGYEKKLLPNFKKMQP